MIVRADIFVMPVFHAKTTGNDAKLLKSQTFIQMSGMDIRSYHGIKL